MKKFFVPSEGGFVTIANLPIKENGVASKVHEVTEEQLNSVQEGTHDFQVEDGNLVLRPSNRKAQIDAMKLAEAQRQEEAANLKKKLSEGKASLEEIQNALSKLL